MGADFFSPPSSSPGVIHYFFNRTLELLRLYFTAGLVHANCKFRCYFSWQSYRKKVYNISNIVEEIWVVFPSRLSEITNWGKECQNSLLDSQKNSVKFIFCLERLGSSGL